MNWGNVCFSTVYSVCSHGLPSTLSWCHAAVKPTICDMLLNHENLGTDTLLPTQFNNSSEESLDSPPQTMCRVMSVDSVVVDTVECQNFWQSVLPANPSNAHCIHWLQLWLGHTGHRWGCSCLLLSWCYFIFPASFSIPRCIHWPCSAGPCQWHFPSSSLLSSVQLPHLLHYSASLSNVHRLRCPVNYL